MLRALFILLAFACPAAAKSPLPFDIGGPFSLIDDKGNQRSEVNPDGLPQLLFFGYANCLQICSVAMPLMADATDALAEEGLAVTPVMITVDPDRDTVDTMGPKLAELHPEFRGLTGTHEALAQAYKAFSVEHELVFDDPLEGPVYSHGSFIYLLDADGRFLTLMPPILSVDKTVEIVTSHIAPKAASKQER